MTTGTKPTLTGSRQFKMRNGAASLCIGLLTLEFYWPQVFCAKGGHTPIYGFMLKTGVLYRPAKNWAWDYSLCITVLGFGVGGAWNHCDNPAYISRVRA
jgi:hypothetical protein